MSAETINPDGTPVLIEAVYWQQFNVYREKFVSIEQACRFLDSGEDYGTLSSVGVFVDGKPRVLGCDIYDLEGANLDQMHSDYAKAQTV